MTKSIPLIVRPSNSLVILLAGLLAVGVVGFIPSYFVVLKSTSLSMHIHAFFMYLWLIGLVCMPIFIRTGHSSWHRMIGYLSPFVVLAMLYSGVIVTINSLNRYPELDLQVIGIKRLPIMTLAAFSILYLLGLVFRKDPRAHSRFMLSTGIVIIGPALRRILLLIPSTELNFATISFLLLGALTLGLICLDVIKGYFRTPYWLTLALLVLMLFGFYKWWAVFNRLAAILE